jgi:hypothetical protein
MIYIYDIKDADMRHEGRSLTMPYAMLNMVQSDMITNIDILAKSQKLRYRVISVKAGIL